MTTITDKDLRAAGGATSEGVGVVESDLADDSTPDYAGMSDDEREIAFEALVGSGVDEDEARTQVYGATEAVEEKPTPPMQIPLPGLDREISAEFGGRLPESSEIRLMGGKLPIDGSYPKGTVLDLHVKVKITGVGGHDLVDAWGQEEATVRRHSARMISVRRLTT